MSYLLILLLGLVAPAPATHEYHVSKSRINYDVPTRAYQITLHLFIDDLETALRARGAEGLRIGTARESDAADTHLLAYLRDQLQLRADDRALTYTLLGKEVAEDLMGLYVYLEIPDQAVPARFEVTNALLTEVFDDQQNIVQLDFGPAATGYFICNRADPSERLEFE